MTLKPRKVSRWLIWLVFVAAILATLIVSFYVVEGWRGRGAWARYRTEAIASGIKLDWADYVPPDVPRDQNYAAVPLIESLLAPTPAGAPPHEPLAPPKDIRLSKVFSGELPGLNLDERWGEWQQYFIAGKMLEKEHERPVDGVLAAMERYRPTLDQLTEAGKRPTSKFPQEGWYLNTLLHAQLWWWLRARAELANGNQVAALQDLSDLQRSHAAFESEPGLLPGIVSLRTIAYISDVAWDGLARGIWTEPELLSFQAWFSKLHLIEDARRAWSGERAAMNRDVEALVSASNEELRDVQRNGTFSMAAGEDQKDLIKAALYPRGWIYQNLVTLNRIYDRRIAQFDPARGRIDFTALDWTLKQEFLDEDGDPPKYLPPLHRILPEGDGIAYSYGRKHTTAQQVIVACALERFRRAHGKFPTELTQLLPTFLQAIPRDVVDGEPLRYQTNEGGYELWSLGVDYSSRWGTRPKDQLKEKRWVWRIPAAPPGK